MNGKRLLDDHDQHTSKRQKLHCPPTPDSLPLSPASTSRDARPLIYHCSFAPCTRSFTRPCRLAEHERSHTGERPFICPQCRKSFARDYHLSRHLSLSHSTNRDYSCSWPVCGKAFATTQRRNEHEKTHLRTKHFTCTSYNGCEAVFRKKSTLAVHINKVHLGIKPYLCDKIDHSTNEPCRAGYETAGKLREHIRRAHSGVPRFYCSICKSAPQDKTLAQSIQPDSFVDSHLAFNSLHDLLSHKRRHHPSDSSLPGVNHGSSTLPPNLAKPRLRANQYTSQTTPRSIDSAADLLTGTPTTVLEIQCLKPSCHQLFSEVYALLSHCSNVHGMAEVEVTESLREREANEGGVFWIGAEYDELDDEEEAWFDSLFVQVDDSVIGQGIQDTNGSNVDPNLR
jgi:uncharacterized C2H2 Zn-finger protein